MNEQVLFDRLRYMDKLRAAGIPEEHARAFTDALHTALRELADRVARHDKREDAPWVPILLGVIGLCTGAALFAAGMAFMKFVQ